LLGSSTRSLRSRLSITFVSLELLATTPRIDHAPTGTAGPLADEVLLGLQVIIEDKQPVPEGELIKAVSVPWAALIREVQRDPNFLRQIDWRKMEELIAAAYHDEKEYEVTLTPRSGDRGRDVIAQRKGRFSVRFLDQVKAFGPGYVVKANDVRAMYGVLSLDQGASKAYITTTSDFAPDIENEFRNVIPGRLELRNGKKIVEWFAHLARKE
jgi:restriction system protein